jgi:superfamily II DNA/RNA helicase
MNYLQSVQTLAEQLSAQLALNKVTIPDLWQQEAVQALREGNDVVVQAPTGAGKTLIFELWSNFGKNRGQAIYTVPTRALANDKMAEWRARGWDVGIATGDVAENLRAPIVVATLETQKHRLIQGDGPALLVVDEYQMLGDEDRGLNYELAMALAPPRTQLLLLSGSVSNPQDLVKWLQRLGRKAALVRHNERPVPLEEVHAYYLGCHLPSDIKTYWARLVAKALAENLGPILIFAPRRQAAEKLAAELARQLPTPNPLTLRPDQKQLVGDHLARLLKARIAYHHSGLSYGARAGVIEPLAKAGQLRVVVATMGLAAGINFSLRSVALAADSYRREYLERPLRPDEILQMLGRAGRRSIDETGYVLVSANQIGLRDAYVTHLSRSGLVDWSALLSIMAGAADQGKEPFAEAVKVQQRLFTTKPIFLGVEHALKHPETPCGLKTDSERARHVRRKIRQMRNSRGEWELMPRPTEHLLRDIMAGSSLPQALSGPAEDASPPASPAAPPLPVLRPVLSEPVALQKVGQGKLCELFEQNGQKIYGRAVTVAELLHRDRVLLAKWIRRLTNWTGRQVPRSMWDQKVVPLLADRLAKQKTPVVRFEEELPKIIALLSLGDLTMRVPVDQHGVPMWKPEVREVAPEDCAVCNLAPVCRELPAATGVASLWRRLGLVDAGGIPTLRGRVVSFFSQGYGLGIAAALEETSYPLDELIYDLANLDAGFRFCREEDRWAGRLVVTCHHFYGLQTVPGYLENGVPPRYGSGAEQIVASVHKSPSSKHTWINESLGAGDIDRVIIEWRSLLRQITHAAELEWPRWLALKAMAKGILQETESPTLTQLPPLDYSQTKRIDHRLVFRRL